MQSDNQRTPSASKVDQDEAQRAASAPEVSGADKVVAIEDDGAQQDTRLEAVVERLRTSHESDLDELRSSGSSDGKLWAEQSARATELRRLTRARHPYDDWYFGVGSSAYSDAERFFFIIRPDDDGDRTAAEEFWESVSTDSTRLSETEYIQAFAEAAAELWVDVFWRI